MKIQRLINLLSGIFKHFGVQAAHDNDNADLFIAEIAIAKVRDILVNITCKEADVIWLLWHYFDRNGHNIEVCTLDQIWKIRKLKKAGSQDYILLAHSILGRNTTARIDGLENEMALKIDKMKEACKHASLAFYERSCKNKDI